LELELELELGMEMENRAPNCSLQIAAAIPQLELFLQLHVGCYQTCLYVSGSD